MKLILNGQSSLSPVGRTVILAAAYFLGGMLGRQAGLSGGDERLVWPPFGIALAAILLFGYSYWPGVALGSLFFAFLDGLPLGAFTFGIVVGNTVSAVLCAYLLERFVQFRSSLERVRDVAGLVSLAAVLGTAMCAMFDVVTLAYSTGKIVGESDLLPELIRSWVPNAMAALVVTPVLLSWGTPQRGSWQKERVIEGVVCWTGLLAATNISLNSWFAYGIASYPMAFLPYPFLVWSALRFGQRGATVGTLLIATVAIYGLQHGKGPFMADKEEQRLVLIISYMGVLSITNMMLAAAAIERRWAEEALRKSEQMFTLISENVSDLIAVSEEDGRTVYHSPSYQRVLGETSIAPGNDTLESVHPDDRDRVRATLRSAAQIGSAQRAEFRFQLRDGKERHIELLANYVKGDGHQGGKVVSVARDITERKQFEADLANARDAALVSARLKAEFLANMSHEIRTPMNGVIGLSNLLLQTELTGTQRDYAVNIRRSADSLLTIINDILDFSKIESGKLQFETIDFDLRECVEGCLDLLAHTAQAKGVELLGDLAPDLPVRLRGDPGRLRQILSNLTSNAVKFTDRGEVVVTVTRISETDKEAVLRFEVSDTGVGVPPEAQSRLFQAFSQADGSTTRKYGGTGLGLAISKQLVTLLEGRIGMESSVGRGSTFWFTVPLEKQAGPAAPASPLGVEFGRYRALLVDDNNKALDVLGRQLTAWGLPYESACGGTEALDRLHSPNAPGFNVVLIDHQMPVVDGLAMAKLIKNDPTVGSPRLILLNNLGQPLREDQLRAVGVEVALSKPLKQNRLLEALKFTLGDQADRRAHIPAVVSQPTASGFNLPKGVRILLAEDNVINQMVALAQLEQAGATADVVADGKQVLDAINARDYNILLLDCQMPEMDGFEVARRIRDLEHGPSAARRPGPPMYMIAMTASVMTGDREKCIEAGMNDYVSKPVDMDELTAALQRAVATLPQTVTPPAPEKAPEAPAVIPARPAPTKDASLVDLRRLKRVTFDDPVKLKELVKLYLTQGEDLMKGLEAAIQNRSAQQLEHCAHKLCGASSNCGITSVVHPLRELERCGREQTLDEAGPPHAELVKQYALVREFLSKLIAST